MNLTKTSNDSFIGKVAREIGTTFATARDAIASPSALSSSFVSAAATAFLSFGITAAAARGQFNAAMNGTADGLISGVSFGDSNDGPTLIQKEKKKAEEAYTRAYIASIFDSIDRDEITEEIVERLLKDCKNGRLRHADVDRCIHDYMSEHYGPDFEQDPYYDHFRDGVKSQLRDRDIQIVIIDLPQPSSSHLGQSFQNRVIVAVIDPDLVKEVEGQPQPQTWMDNHRMA